MKNFYNTVKKGVRNFASRQRHKYASLSSRRQLSVCDSERKPYAIPGIVDPQESQMSQNSSNHSPDHVIAITASRNNDKMHSDISKTEDVLWRNFILSRTIDDNALKGSKKNVLIQYFDKLVSNVLDQKDGEKNFRELYVRSKSESVVSNRSSGRIYPDTTTKQVLKKSNSAGVKDHGFASIIIDHDALDSKDVPIPTIIKDMSEYKDSVQVQAFCCKQLKYLAKQNVANKQSIMVCGGVPAIVSAIENHSHDASLVTLAFTSLCSLTSHDSSNKHEISKTHLIQYVLSTMKHFADNEAIQKEGCETLFNLTFAPTHLFKLKSATTTTIDPRAILADASRSFPGSCRNISSVTLKRLSPNENDIIEMIQSVDSDLEDVTLIMSNYLESPTIQDMACVKLDILSKIPDLDDGNGNVAGASSLILPSLFAAMREYRDRVSLQSLACSILSNLQKNENDSDNNYLNNNVTPEMVDLVADVVKRFKRDDVVQEKGCAFLHYCK